MSFNVVRAAAGPLLAFLLTSGLVSRVEASSGDAQMFTWGYAGCQLLVLTSDFELEPGEVFEFTVDQSRCKDRDIGNVGYFGYKVGKWRSRELLSRDRIDLKIIDFDTGSEIDYAAYNGYETLGDVESSQIELQEPTHLRFSAVNTGRRAVKIRLQVQSGM